MKQFLKKVFLSGVLSAFMFSLNAQKIAVVELDSLISIMPETAKAKEEAQAYYKQLEGTLLNMQNELQAKYDEYVQKSKEWTDLIRQTKEKELNDLDQRIKDFQLKAQEEFRKKSEDLTKPINDKAKAAIQKVAKANGYKYVLDKSFGGVLYNEPADDIFNLVKKELGLK
jgi:outer membrane protein